MLEIWAIGIALFGMPPAGVRNEQMPRIVREGPRISALLLTGLGSEPEVELSKLRRLIQITPDGDPNEPNLWLRLGMVCMYRWDHSFDGHPHTRQQREAYFSEALVAFHTAAAFEGFDGIDCALFGLARLHLAARDTESARPYIDRLGREYPASRYVPQVDLLYADELFSRNELAAALAWYSMAEQLAEPSTLPYALYGKGWCFLRRGDFDAGRFALAEAVRTADQANNRSSNRIVRGQAARALARVTGGQR